MSFNWPPGENEARVRFGKDFDGLHVDSRIATSRSILPDKVAPLVTPIYHSSTYKFQSVDQFSEGNHGSNHVYQRCGNPTVENVEVILNEIERGAATLLYNSGLAAASAVLLEFLSSGDHLICMKPIYSGTYSFITETLVRFGITVDFVDVELEKDFPKAIEAAIKENTKMVFMEIMANPSMAVPDLLGVLEVTKKKELLCFLDSTFASPYLIQPIGLGVDFNLHSCSKYIGGHSDVIAGCVTTRSIDNWRRLKMQQLTTGSSLSPFDASLLARGLQTLSIRVDRISTSALAVAEHLEKHPKVVRVFYAGLPSHPQFAAASRLMTQHGGMIAFDVGSDTAAIAVVENVRLINHAVSLGGTESLIEHPGSMSHGKQLLRDPNAPAVSPGLIRLSIGVEKLEDLLADLDRAISFV